MRHLSLLAVLGGTAALAACAPPPSTTTVIVPPATAECTAADYQSFIGQQSPAITLPPGTEFRHYRTGEAVATDANPARLNFEYDRSGRLVSVTCG